MAYSKDHTCPNIIRYKNLPKVPKKCKKIDRLKIAVFREIVKVIGPKTAPCITPSGVLKDFS